MVRAAVLGLGVMGQNHVRVLRSLVDDVVGVDPVPAARRECERRFGVSTVRGMEELSLSSLDAAVVAVPSTHHEQVAVPLLRAGVPCLIEKPLAPTVISAEAIVAAAEGVVAMVGHIERFNPAVIELGSRIHDAGDLFVIATRRVGPYPSRINDVGVRLDLLTHDTDIVRAVTGQEISGLKGVDVAFLGRSGDHVAAIAELSGGTVATFEVGWLSPSKIREVRVIGRAGTFVADLLLQDLYFHENAVANQYWDALATFRGVSEGNMIKFAIRRQEPLRAELIAFLEAVSGRTPSLIPLSEGLRAVRDVEALEPLFGADTS